MDSKIGKTVLGKTQTNRKAKNILQHFLEASSDIKKVFGINLLKDDVIKNIIEWIDELCEGDIYDVMKESNVTDN